MIVRNWSGRVPLDRAEAFRRHIKATGMEEFRNQPGCVDLELWRRDEDGWAIFTLVSTWKDMASIIAHAGPDPTCAIHYPGDEAFGLIPDLMVTHHELIEIAP